MRCSLGFFVFILANALREFFVSELFDEAKEKEYNKDNALGRM